MGTATVSNVRATRRVRLPEFPVNKDPEGTSRVRVVVEYNLSFEEMSRIIITDNKLADINITNFHLWVLANLSSKRFVMMFVRKGIGHLDSDASFTESCSTEFCERQSILCKKLRELWEVDSNGV